MAPIIIVIVIVIIIHHTYSASSPEPKSLSHKAKRKIGLLRQSSSGLNVCVSVCE